MRPDIDEILRYLRIRGEAGALRARVERAAEGLARTLPPKWVYRAFPLEHTAEGVVLAGSGVTLRGTLAERMLRPCGAAVLLCCTLGMAFEQRVRALERRLRQRVGGKRLRHGGGGDCGTLRAAISDRPLQPRLR